MTEPYELDDDEVLRARPRTDAWIDRVRAADAEAEAAYGLLYVDTVEDGITKALVAIAAELRAQRIARRPGAGQK